MHYLLSFKLIFYHTHFVTSILNGRRDQTMSIKICPETILTFRIKYVYKTRKTTTLTWILAEYKMLTYYIRVILHLIHIEDELYSQLFRTISQMNDTNNALVSSQHQKGKEIREQIWEVNNTI